MKTYFNFINEVKSAVNTVEDFAKILSFTYGKISLDKFDATDTIKNLVVNEWTYRKDPELPTRFRVDGLSSDTNLNDMKPSNKIRMYNYLNSLLTSKTVRGDSFEGLIAGLFNGVVSPNKNSKFDITIATDPTIGDDIKLSIKFLDSEKEYPVLGNVRQNIINYIASMDIPESDKSDMLEMNLFDIIEEIGHNGFSDILNDAFGEVTHFLIGFPGVGLNINYYTLEKNYLINNWLNDTSLQSAPKSKGSYQIRLNLPQAEALKGNKFTIIAPTITQEDLNYLRIQNEYPATKLFGSDAYRIRGSILNAILKFGEFKTLPDEKTGKKKDYFVFDFIRYKRKRGHYPKSD